jgi:hypothetical protein
LVPFHWVVGKEHVLGDGTHHLVHRYTIVEVHSCVVEQARHLLKESVRARVSIIEPSVRAGGQSELWYLPLRVEGEGLFGEGGRDVEIVEQVPIGVGHLSLLRDCASQES